MTAFRTKAPTTTTDLGKGKDTTRSGDETNVEVPFNDYESQHGQPYLVDHYKLGDTWADKEGGFVPEVTTINDYLKSQIESGELANSVSAIKNKLKGIEKMTNMSKEERAVVKLETMAAYVKFLMTTDDIKHKIKKYGHY